MVTMAQSAANWRNTHTHVDRSEFIVYEEQRYIQTEPVIFLFLIAPTTCENGWQIVAFIVDDAAE